MATFPRLSPRGAAPRTGLPWCGCSTGVAQQLANGATAWLEALPPALVHHDPWLALATARSGRAEGRWDVALECYSRAGSALGATRAAADCRRERMVLAAWLDGSAVPLGHWTGLLRTGLAREPLTAARDAAQLDGAVRPLVRGLLMLVGGDARSAGRTLASAAEDGRLDPFLRAAASLGAAVAAMLSGDRRSLVAVTRSVEAAEQAGVPWLAAIARELAQALVGVDPTVDRPASGDDAEAPADPFDRPTGDGGWLAALGALARAWVSLVVEGGDDEAAPTLDRRLSELDRAATEFRRLGAGILEAWARALASLAHANGGLPEAREQALAVESLGRLTGVPGVRLLAYRALEVADPDRGRDYQLLAEATAAETGLDVPTPRGRLDPGSGFDAVSRGRVATRSVDAPTSPSVDIAVLGGLRILVAGSAVEHDAVKPRARALLRLLALNAPSPVHREVVQEALWPAADPSTGARSLQVAISSLRGLFASTSAGDVSRLIERRGDAYRLAVEPEAVDLQCFERAVAHARTLVAAGLPAIGELRSALDLYTGDVLPEDGPAEWVVARRDRARLEAVETSINLAEAALAADDPQAAIQACQVGLGLDRFHDPLWRLLIAARERAGDAGAASRDRREYAAVLEGLGVPAGDELAASPMRA